MAHFSRKKWRTLENTAKIFPATSGKKDERVFRLSCQLTEEIDQVKLQKALDLCMEDYSLFLCVLRCGIFWNYLEESELKPVVREEYPGALVLGDGACDNCRECTYPDAPCRFPERQSSAMEAYGMLVSEVCQQNDILYYYGPGTLTYVGCILVE